MWHNISLVLFFFMTVLSSLSAGLFDWSKLSQKGERAQKVLEGIDLLFEKALKDFEVPGLALGIVVDGQVIWAKGYGCRDLECSAAVTPETVFPIGSCTKAFTTFALAMLNQESLLSWDQQVIDILPEFRLWDEYATHNTTFRDLAVHRTGLSRHDFMWYGSNYSRSELLYKMRYLEPASNFRERYNYNNLMYMVSGLAIERIRGKTWEEFVRSKILTPLKMYNTSFSIAELQKETNVAFPYIEKGQKLKRMAFRDLSNIGPAGSMNSTVYDMTHWMQMLLAGGTYEQTSLISPVMIQEMQSPQMINSGYPEKRELLGSAYGLGWDILSYRGHYCVGHDGGVDGFTSALCLLPNEGIGVVVFANKNLTTLPRLIAYEVFDRILELPLSHWLKEGFEKVERSRKEALAASQKENSQRRVGTSLSHPLKQYAGEYEHLGYGRLSIQEKEGILHATLNGITYILEHWHYDVFSVVEELQDLLISRQGIKFAFRLNQNGEIEELHVPFETGIGDIVFKKRPDDQFSNLAYFRQFTGCYEFYNLIVEVAIRNRTLVAVMPGQPLYELLPLFENEFQVKGKAGYNIRFIKGVDQLVEEALLIPPYGVSWSARKKS